MEDLYKEHKAEAISEFTKERLQSYYLANPMIAEASHRELSYATRLLQEKYIDAAFVFSYISIETGLKAVVIKPFVHGLVHSTSTADFVSDLAMGNLSIKRFQNFIFQILLEHAGIDFRQFKRQGASDTLWTEIEQVQKIRNRIVHRAEEVTPEDADLSISVAHSVLDEIFPALISGLGLHLHEGIRVCNDYLCKLRPVLSSEIIALLRKKNKNG